LDGWHDRLEGPVRVRWIVGALMSVVGVIWILQGVGVLRGSGMTGHGQFTVLGAVVALIGLALLYRAVRVRRRPAKAAGS
jgi:drug/metabolite transporter (DMT)-like permease